MAVEIYLLLLTPRTSTSRRPSSSCGGVAPVKCITQRLFAVQYITSSSAATRSGFPRLRRRYSTLQDVEVQQLCDAGGSYLDWPWTEREREREKERGAQEVGSTTLLAVIRSRSACLRYLLYCTVYIYTYSRAPIELGGCRRVKLHVRRESRPLALDIPHSNTTTTSQQIASRLTTNIKEDLFLYRGPGMPAHAKQNPGYIYCAFPPSKKMKENFTNAP